ncbi:MAG TPA: CAP domain-containing protein [Pyrinomonadaceae bacterium]|nr:CAP domain-containing protein [Pyrinomonadaceae bacterium]
MISPHSRLRWRSILSIISFTFLTIAFTQIASGQDRGQPLARLLTNTSDITASRPRVVGSVLPPHESAAPVPEPSLAETTAAERNAFSKTNEARLKHGLLPLTWDAELCRLARIHSENMARLGYFDHETPEGLQLKDRARALGIGRFKVIGENIAYNKGYDDPGGFAVERWMNSGGHRANILYPGFQAAGIGSFIAADGSVYLTQVFVTR